MAFYSRGIFFLVFIFTSISSLILGQIIFQWAPKAEMPSNNQFSGIRAFEHWKQLCASVPDRHASTTNYNISYNYVLSEIQKYHQISLTSKTINLSYEEEFGEIYETKMGRILQVERDTRNILVLIQSKKINLESRNASPVMISAHIDGGNRGPAAYDDAAGIASMLEAIHLLVESKNPPSRSVIFLFVGVEELGLQGSQLFLKYRNCTLYSGENGCFINQSSQYLNIASLFNQNSSSFLNIESLGPGLPLGIMQKGNGSYSTINSLKKMKGLVFGSFADDVTKSGLITSTSDAVRFRENALSGAELLFFGNPTKYHTTMDSIIDQENNLFNDQSNIIFSEANKIMNHLKYKTTPIMHLQLLGNAVVAFILNNDNLESEIHAKENVVAIGVTPYAIVINMDIVQKLIWTLIIIVITIFAFYVRKLMIRVFVAFFVEVISFLLLLIILLLFSKLQFEINSLFYSRSVALSFIYLLFCGLSIYLFLFSCFTSPKNDSSLRKLNPFLTQSSLILFDSILIICLRNFDSSTIFVWQLIFSIASLFALNFSIILAAFLNLLGFVYVFFTFFLLFNFMSLYSSLIPGVIADLIPFAIISLFSYILSITFIPFIIQSNNDDTSTNQNTKFKNPFIVLVVISTVMLILPLFGPPPYNSESYVVQGNIAHIVDPINGSYVAFAPVAMKRVFKGIFRQIKSKVKSMKSIETKDDFEMPLRKRDVFFRNVSTTIPPFVHKWPHFTITTINATTWFTSNEFNQKVSSTNNQMTESGKKMSFYFNLIANSIHLNKIKSIFFKKWPSVEISEEELNQYARHVIVTIPGYNQDLISINLVLNCSNTPCLRNINHMGDITSFTPNSKANWVSNREHLIVKNFEFKDSYGFRYAMRIIPAFQPSIFNFTVFGLSKIPMKITFSWDNLTEEAAQLLTDLPYCVRPMGNVRSIVDTTLVNYTYI